MATSDTNTPGPSAVRGPRVQIAPRVFLEPEYAPDPERCVKALVLVAGQGKRTAAPKESAT